MVVGVVEIKGFSKEDLWKRTGIGTGHDLSESGGKWREMRSLSLIHI